MAELAEEPQASYAGLTAGAGIALAAMLVLAGCFSSNPASTPALSRAALPSASAHPLNHTVSRGETVYHIAHLYGITTERLMAANGIGDPRELRVGQTLVIPRSGFAEASAFGTPEVWEVPRAERQFEWPIVAGVVSSPFGMRHGVMHDGVDIAAPAGTPVHAADDGVVIFTGELRGYGNVVIVQHSGAYVTVYGHNERNLVREGERVGRGQEIAEVGTSGRTTGPNLHFEVRYDNHAENPLAYLPQPEPASGISFASNGGS